MIIQFLPLGTAVGDALSVSYNVILVVVSYLIAALASYAGLQMSACIADAESARGRWVWLAGGSAALGIGIWAMHFTGMLALNLPVGVSYGIPTTALSVVPAILASGVALHLGGNNWPVIGTSIGVAILDSQTVDKTELMKAADEAMYAAKKAGGSGFRFDSLSFVQRLIFSTGNRGRRSGSANAARPRMSLILRPAAFLMSAAAW